MRAKLSTLILMAAWIGLNGASAQDLKQIPPPTLPLVAAVPENTDWTVSVQYPPEDPKPPPAPDAPVKIDRRIAEVHSSITGKFKRDAVTYVNGTTAEYWFVDSLFLSTNPHGEVSVADISSAPEPPPGTSPDVSPSVSSGFPGMRWVKLDNYDKVVVFETVPCYHFLYSPEGPEAWINVKTRLPVAYQVKGEKDKDILYRFQFNAPPSSPLTLPPAYQKAWDTVQIVIKNRR